MNWKTRAVKVEPSKSPELSRWKKDAIAKENKRAETKEIGDLQRKSIVENVAEGAEDMPRAFVSGASLGFHDEALGGIVAAYQKATGDPRPYGELYEEARDAERGKIEEGRKRSPIATFLAEMGGGAAISSLGIAGKVAGKIPKIGTKFPTSGALNTAAEGFSIGYGESTKEDLSGNLIDAAATGITSGLLHKAGEKVSDFIFPDSSNLRAKYTGADLKDFKKHGGFGDPEVIAADAHKMRAFKYSKSNYNFKTHQLDPVGKTGRNTPTRVEALQNWTDNLEKMAKEKARLVKTNASKPLYYGKDIAESPAMVNALGRLEADSTDINARDIVDNIAKEVEFHFNNNHEYINAFGEKVVEPQGIDLTRVDALKSAYQEKASKFYDSIDPMDREVAEKYTSVADALKLFIENNTGKAGKQIKKINHSYYTLKNSSRRIHKEIARDKYGASEGITKEIPMVGTALYQGGKIIDNIQGGPKMKLGRASVGDFLRDKVPEPVKKFGGQLAPRGTQTLLNTHERENSVNRREPQSIPEQLIRTPLPRNSEEFLDKKDFVLMKAAQQAPELFDNLKDILENSPEDVPELLPILAQQAPHLFPRDKYNRIDGVILNPEDKIRATKDTMNRDDLSNHDKMKMINELNKTGVFYDN